MALKPRTAAELASLLPSTPVPPASSAVGELDGAALIGMVRVGGAEISPDGAKAVLHTKV
jgi:hypothetical protein